jgi:hypothetical protein
MPEERAFTQTMVGEKRPRGQGDHRFEQTRQQQSQYREGGDRGLDRDRDAILQISKEINLRKDPNDYIMKNINEIIQLQPQRTHLFIRRIHIVQLNWNRKNVLVKIVGIYTTFILQ